VQVVRVTGGSPAEAGVVQCGETRVLTLKGVDRSTTMLKPQGI
jgi:hypothetical protein